MEQLKDAVVNVLKVAIENDLHSVAFPSIASGSNNFPKHTAAQTILRSIKGFINATTDCSLKQVFFVLYDLESYNVYTSELQRMEME